MIYAIGNRWRYEPQLDGPRPLYKLGKGRDQKTGVPYAGGSVWQTEADAQAFIVAQQLHDSHRVYGVEADWEKDTEQLPGEPYRRLLRNALIVRLGSPKA